MQGVLTLINVLACGVALLLLLPSGLLLIQVLAACRPAPIRVNPERGRRPPLAVLIPAHNESSGILPTLHSLRAQLEPGDRLVVVADNCTDDTAAAAAAAGAEVAVRNDTTRRGKGYALDHGLQFLGQSGAPEVVIFVDADCLVGAGGIDTLARACAASGRPEQALYLMQAPPGAGLKSRMAEFAWLVKNHVRALGFHRLGLPCQLTGSGMALPWPLLQGVHLATGSIVEDLQLGLDLAQSGRPPRFCGDAVVTSVFPTQAAGLQAQRTRWEHGHLELTLSRGLPLLWRGMRQRRLDVAAMALDLCVPPLSSLVAVTFAVLVMAAAFGVLAHRWLPLLASLAALGAVALSVLLARSHFGAGIISLTELTAVPKYVLSKIPSYIRFVWQRQTEWVRTERNGKPPDSQG